jgi:hypothetical protein
VVSAQGNTLASYDYDTHANPRTDGTAAVLSTVHNPVRFAGA